MMLIMQILAVLGVGLVIYAVFGVSTSGSGKSKTPKKQKPQNPFLPAEDSNPGQAAQGLETQTVNLESPLAESSVSSQAEKSELAVLKTKEAEFSTELKRREEWVTKAEEELAKIKTENLDLNRKFAIKDKELQEEFAKNVNLTREMREIKSALEAKEMACRLKEDQVQLQKHQIESQLKSINESSAAIAEFNRKEKISEWVPKLEFNKLNEEYTKLEKDLEAAQEKLKSFAIEIAHLRQAAGKTVSPAEEAKLPPEAIPEETIPEKTKPEETKAVVETKDTEKNLKINTEEIEEQK